MSNIRERVLTALGHLTMSDFKTVKKKFLDQEIEEEEVDSYIQEFKKLKDGNRITKTEDKNIDNWGKKPFAEFKSFIDELKSKRSKTQEQKFRKMKGADLVAENDEWYVYKITTHDAAMIYGAGTQWCITEKDGHRWYEYSADNDFYFILSKDRDKSDPWYKIAYQINVDGEDNYWDATDESHGHDDVDGSGLNIPDFKVDEVVPTVNLYRIKTDLEEVVEQAVSDRYDDEYPEDYLSDAEEDWDFSNVSDDVKDQLEEMKGYLGKNDTLEDWGKFIRSISEVIQADEEEKVANVIATYTKEYVVAHLGGGLMADVDHLTDEEMSRIMEDILPETSYDLTGSGLELDIPTTWVYSIDDGLLEKEVNRNRVLEKWKKQKPSQEELGQTYMDYDFDRLFKSEILEQIHDDNVLADIYLTVLTDRAERHRLLSKIDNVEVLKDMFLKRPDKDILKELKNEKGFLLKFFKEAPDVNHMPIKKDMIHDGLVSDPAVIAAFIENNWESPQMSNYFLQTAGEALGESEQELLKKIYYRVDRWSTAVSELGVPQILWNIKHVDWIFNKFLEELDKEHKRGIYRTLQEHKRSEKYDQLYNRLLFEAERNDQLLQKMFALDELERSKRVQLISKSKNQTWLKSIYDQYKDREEKAMENEEKIDDSWIGPSNSFYKAAEDRLKHLNMRGF